MDTSFEPVDLSDFTLHFKGHSFHVHAIMLCKESKYFNSVVKTTDHTSPSCTSNGVLSSTCGKPGHRCLTLPDTLGGHDFTTEDMNTFLLHMYDGSMLLTAYAKGYTSIVPAQTTNGAFSLGGFEEDRLGSFLSKYDSLVKLSYYFDCPLMLKYEEQCCGSLVSGAAKSIKYDSKSIKEDSLWRALVFSQTYHWKLTNDVIKVVSKDKRFNTRACWSTVSKSLTTDTLIRLLELMAGTVVVAPPRPDF